MKRRTRVTESALGLLLAGLLMGGAEGLDAQRRGAQQPGRADQRVEMERRIQARFDGLVQEELGLTDEQAQQLQDVVLDFRSRRVDFSQRERSTRARVGRMSARAGGAEPTEQEASEILEEMLELSGEEATLFREEQEGLLQILSAPQVLRFIMMRQRFGDRIRNLRGAGGAGRGPQGGRRPGPPPRGR